MAVLRGPSGDVALPCRAVIGRSSLADVVLSSQRASSEHATLSWSNGRWTLRDLNSSNGTTVNGRPLLTRDRASVTAGSKLCFGGDAEEWTLADAAAPQPAAVLLGPQMYAFGERSLLVLGSHGKEGDEPEASVFPDEQGWSVDDGTEVRRYESGDILRLKSGYWRLLLPELGTGSETRTVGHELDLRQVVFSFELASNQVVSLVLTQGSNSVALQVRSCLNTLWELARVRLEQPSAGDEAGWINTMALAQKLKCSPEKVNVDVHRLRKLLQESGVHEAAQIVERDDAKRVRIGTSKIHYRYTT